MKVPIFCLVVNLFLAIFFVFCPQVKCNEKEILCQAEEIHTSDGCKCGTSDSCLGNRRGEICDSKNSQCMCSKGIEACKEGEYCLDRVCSECRFDSDCPLATPICQVGKCHECRSHSDCPSKHSICRSGKCRAPCQPKDSDSCLQSSPGWNYDYICSNSFKWCETWAKDMKRCCPETCKSGKFTSADCNALGWKGKCYYPNAAQCPEIDNNLLIIGGVYIDNSNWTSLSDVEIIRTQENKGICDPLDVELPIKYHSSVATSYGVVTCGGEHRDLGILSKCTIQSKEGQAKSFPSMVRPRESFALTENNKKLYAIGGRYKYGGWGPSTWSLPHTMETLQLPSGHWVEEKLPFNITLSEFKPLSKPCLVSVDDSIYLISGYSDITTRILNTTSNTWTEGPSFKEKRRGYSCFYDKLSNTVYVIGGMQSWPEKFLQTTLKLNLEKNIWETVWLPRWYGFHGSAAVASRSEEYIGFVAGGLIMKEQTNTVWGLRRSDEHWIQMDQHLKIRRSGHSMVNVASNEIPGC